MYVCVCKLLETWRFNTLLCCQKVHVCIFAVRVIIIFQHRGAVNLIPSTAQRRRWFEIVISSRDALKTYLFFQYGKRLSQEPHTCSREVTRFYEKFFDVSRSFGVSRSSLKFREVSVFREVMTMPTIFYFHDGPYIISMTSSIRHDVDQIILMRPFSCRMTTPPIPTRPR